jgi:hypothetical protein
MRPSRALNIRHRYVAAGHSDVSALAPAGPLVVLLDFRVHLKRTWDGTYLSTPDRLNVYPRAPRSDPNVHRSLVDPTIRGVRFGKPHRQVKQHPQPRTEATSS